MFRGRVLRLTGCANCRLALVRTFASISGPSIRIPKNSTTLLYRSAVSNQFRHLSQLSPADQGLDSTIQSGREAGDEDLEREEREERGVGSSTEEGEREVVEEYNEELATEPRRAVDEDWDQELDEDFEQEWDEELDGEAREILEEGGERKQGAEIASVPWYLQVDAPQRAPQPLSERQKIPDLPEAPPPILEPLMQQVSVELGMDDLTLLDLRKLDPPPALGANLLMLVGTARSEKHLHVSADRLCRWLRSTYKLRPDADGLLGRNELKLKLRRRAKRAKLLGSAEDDERDDGVRTGWVCVELGVVEANAAAIEAPQRQDFVGFGRRIDGVRIVVQMLTEEKRDQIELENLWTGILKRSGQNELELADSQQAVVSEPVLRLPRIPSITTPSNFGQRRTLHTHSRFIDISESPAPPLPVKKHPYQHLVARQPRRLGKSLYMDESHSLQKSLEAMKNAAIANLKAGYFKRVQKDFSEISQHSRALKNNRMHDFLLQVLKAYLQEIPQAQALQEINIPVEGEAITPFMQTFHKAVYADPREFGVRAEVWLWNFGRELEHPQYTIPTFWILLRRLQDYGGLITRASYMQLIRSIVKPSPNQSAREAQEVTHTVFKVVSLEMQRQILYLNEGTLVELQELVQPVAQVETSQDKEYVFVDKDSLNSRLAPGIHVQLHGIMMELAEDTLPPFSDESIIRLMNLNARNCYWKEFWQVFAIKHPDRSTTLWAHMFTCIANTNNRAGCLMILDRWIPILAKQNPPVLLEGDVAEAVKACIRVALPEIEEAGAKPYRKRTTHKLIPVWQRLGKISLREPAMYDTGEGRWKSLARNV